MVEIDKIKEQIGYFKVVFSILIAILVSTVGWLANHFENIDVVDVRTISSVFIVIVVSIGIIHVNKKIINYINELEDV